MNTLPAHAVTAIEGWTLVVAGAIAAVIVASLIVLRMLIRWTRQDLDNESAWEPGRIALRRNVRRDQIRFRILAADLAIDVGRYPQEVDR